MHYINPRINLHIKIFCPTFFEQTFNITKNKYPAIPFYPYFRYSLRALLVVLQRKHVLAECGDIAGIWQYR